jgi:ferredoxin-type protein NapH
MRSLQLPQPGTLVDADVGVGDRHRRHWRQEMDSAALFAGLAAIERNVRRGRAYRRLAEVETSHAERFSAEFARAGVDPPPFRPSWRTRWLLALARRFGTAAVLPRIARLEREDARGYAADEEDWFPTEEERANAEWLAAFAAHETSEAAKRLLLRFRRVVIGVVGAVLFLTSLLLLRNAQLEGLWFGLLTGVVVGPVTHYALGKLLVPLGAGRVWCGWACWTAALLDQLPYRQGVGWVPGPARHLRRLHLGLSLALVATLVLAFGYTGGAVGGGAGRWFVAGNVVYWTLAVALAVALRDNRAFCKYACPVSVLLKVTSRPALVKVAGDAAACQACVSKACHGQCPMGIRIADYVAAGTRVLSTECIVCQQCVAVCPPNTLRLSVGLDLGGLDLLQDRVAAPEAAVVR